MSTYPIILTTDVSTPIATSYTFKQEDYGITLAITVQDYDATGKTARIVFHKPDTNFVEYTINPVNGVFIHTLTGMETQAPGIVVADMKFYKDGVRESTSSFIFTVEKDTYNHAVMSGAYSDSLKAAIEEATARAIAAAKVCEDIAVGVLPIANNQSTNVAGYVLDARQANANIAGTLGEKVEENRESIETLNNNLGDVTNKFNNAFPSLGYQAPADLNNIISNCFFAFVSTTINAPIASTNGWGISFVFPYNASYGTQIAFCANDAESTGKNRPIYKRDKYSSIWSPWIKIYPST
jgi:hypothetical protein